MGTGSAGRSPRSLRSAAGSRSARSRWPPSDCQSPAAPRTVPSSICSHLLLDWLPGWPPIVIDKTDGVENGTRFKSVSGVREESRMDSTSGQRMMTRGSRPLAGLLLLAGLTVSSSNVQGQQAAPAAALLDLRQAVIVGPASPNLQEQTALRVLVEEVEKRTLIKLPLSTEVKGGIGSRPVINVGTAANLKVAAPGPEGYVLQTSVRGNQPVVTVAGADTRGMLFGVGRLLRELRMGKGKTGATDTYEPRLEIATGLQISTAPKVKLRGHQLGYRPKTNSYDGWDV